MSCKKILICGFSGAGKTRFMRELEYLAPEPGWDFSDLDQLLMKEKRSDSIAKIIDDHGWEKFRLWERQALERWLKEEAPGVLSLGGGTLNQILFDLYKPIRKIKICYLHASFEDCWERLHLEGTEPRPLVKLGKNELHRIYQERQAVFQQVEWKIANSRGASLQELAQEFWQRVLPS